MHAACTHLQLCASTSLLLVCRDKIYTAEDITGPYMLHASVKLYKQHRKRIEDTGATHNYSCWVGAGML